MEPSPIAIEATQRTEELAKKGKTALVEVAEDIAYGSVRFPRTIPHPAQLLHSSSCANCSSLSRSPALLENTSSTLSTLSRSDFKASPTTYPCDTLAPSTASDSPSRRTASSACIGASARLWLAPQPRPAASSCSRASAARYSSPLACRPGTRVSPCRSYGPRAPSQAPSPRSSSPR